MKLTFYKDNRIDGKHERTTDEIISEFYKTEESKLDMPFERLLLNFMADTYGSFDVPTEKEWKAIYASKNNRKK